MAGLWSTGRGKITFYVTVGENFEGPTSSDLTSLEVNLQNTNGEFKKPMHRNSRGIFFLPQRPYMVLGTLRQQLLYPTWAEEMIPPSDSTKPAGMCITWNWDGDFGSSNKKILLVDHSTRYLSHF
ncbi:hypothetical protein Dsin_011774 [Dipteronia sinensis]|uniref:Uncharacterized protein n=1 Tax=Dipteronia sinensis TaxID=43782 RepID=A0AAE0AI31_9ROSI|nr:hypothetical protein Dsin_011774 [Dipteronia sinensis]